MIRFSTAASCAVAVWLTLGSGTQLLGQTQNAPCDTCKPDSWEYCPPEDPYRGLDNAPARTQSRTPGLGIGVFEKGVEANFSDMGTTPRQPASIFSGQQPTSDMGFGQTQPRSTTPTPAFPASPSFDQTQPRSFGQTQPRSFDPTPTPSFPSGIDFGQTQPRSAPASPSFSAPQDFGSLAPANANFGAGNGADIGAVAAGALGDAAGNASLADSAFGGGGDSDSGGASAAAIAAATGLASEIGGTSTPNMIGDFLNGLTTGSTFSTRVRFDNFEDQGTAQTFLGTATAAQIDAARSSIDAARRNRLTDGFSGGTTGTVTVLESIPGVVDANQSGSFDSNDLTGVNQGLEPTVRGEITSESFTGPTTQDFNTFERTTETSEITATLAEPVPEATLLQIAEERLALEGTSINDSLGDVANFLDIEFIAEDSIYTNRLSVVTDVVGSNTVPDSISVSDTESYQFVYRIGLTLPSANPGEFIGRANFTDNNSPLPRDRVFFDFNFFHNARIGSAQIPMNRFTPGFEKTFFNELMSFEARVPMAVTLSSTLTQDDDAVLAYEIGDLAFALKGLLYEDKRKALAIGTGVTVPTADDFNLNLANGETVLAIENRTVRITPYLGGLYRPSNNSFLQGFISADVAASGNTVFFDENAFNSVFDGDVPSVTALDNVGTLQASNIIKLDVSAGRWLRKDQNQRRITDIAAVIEGHLISSLGDPDVIDLEQIDIGEGDQATVFNITVGSHMYFGERDVLTLGYGVPVTDDRFFDGELRASWNRYF